MKKIKKIINSFVNWVPCRASIIFLLSFVFLLFWTIKFKQDNDFWFLINTGREILKNGFINIEPFTIHSNLAFVPQQWLTDIIFYFIYNKFGMVGMFILVNIINALVIFLLYKLFLLIGNNKYKLAIFGTAVIFLYLMSGFIVTRPQIFDMVFILLEIYLLELYIKKDNKKYLYPLPIISILMINLHASLWVMLFVVFVPYFIGRINLKYTTLEKYKIKPLIIVMLLMLLCGFINPYGIDMILYLFRSFGFEEVNSLVLEMKPLTIRGVGLFTYMLIFFVFLSYYLTKKNEKKITIRYFLLFLGMTYLCLSHLRGAIFLYIVAMIPVMDNFKDDNCQIENYFKSNKYINFTYLILFLVIGTIFLFNIEFKYEEEIVLYGFANYLDENADKNIKLYTNYNTGNYMEYRGYKCYMDARAEVFYKRNNKKEDILVEHVNVGKTINPEEFLDKYNFDYLLVSKTDVLYYYLEKVNYSIVYEADYSSDGHKGYRLYKNNEVRDEKSN